MVSNEWVGPTTGQVSEWSHLWQLAHEILPYSFEMSSYFMSVLQKSFRQNDGLMLMDVPATAACLSCGTLWIPGWTCGVRLRRSTRKQYLRRIRQKKGRRQPVQLKYWVEYECRRCSRIVKFERERCLPNQTGTEAKDAVTKQDCKSRLEINTASRRRKKQREEGLEGILKRMMDEKEKELSLDDFML